MDRESRRRLDEYRREAGPIESNLIDELVEGELSRAEFLRRASIFGLSASAVGTALAALGEAPLAFARPEVGRAGGRIRLAVIPAPTSKDDPISYFTQGDLTIGGIAGEFLTRATATLALKPELATSWKSNKNATVWTFKLRSGVRFHNGTTMNADDVVATFKRLLDPTSQALSAFQGVLKPEGVVKVDNLTVAFHLEAPNASFPYLTSSTTYQAIILPSDYRVGTFAKTPQATGAFKLVSYTPGVGAKYERFANWWGGRPPLDGVDVTYYNDDAALVAALLGGQTDLANQVAFATGRPLFHKANIRIFRARGATHREVPMRVDLHNPLRDYRVRQAIALTLDRPSIVKTLFSNLADLGNDNAVAQRTHEHHRLGQPRGPERPARQRVPEQGHLERRSLLEQEVRPSFQVLRRGYRAQGSAKVQQADRGAAPPRHAGDHPLLLQLPRSRDEARQGLQGRCPGHGLPQPHLARLKQTTATHRAYSSRRAREE